MQEYGTDVCITATNRFFSSDARSFNKEKQDLGFKTYLWNRDFILNQSSEIAYYSRVRENLVLINKLQLMQFLKL